MDRTRKSERRDAPPDGLFLRERREQLRANGKRTHGDDGANGKHLSESLSARSTVPSVALPDPLPLYRGGVLRAARAAYETWGQLNAARDNADPAVHRLVALGRMRLQTRSTATAGLVAADDGRDSLSIPSRTSSS